ncbi:hypothetical protein ACLOJK_001613 [Asimina triloba]
MRLEMGYSSFGCQRRVFLGYCFACYASDAIVVGQSPVYRKDQQLPNWLLTAFLGSAVLRSFALFYSRMLDIDFSSIGSSFCCEVDFSSSEPMEFYGPYIFSGNWVSGTPHDPSISAAYAACVFFPKYPQKSDSHFPPQILKSSATHRRTTSSFSSSSQVGGALTHDLLVFVFITGRRRTDARPPRFRLQTSPFGSAQSGIRVTRRRPISAVRSCSKKHNEGDCWPLDIEPEMKDKCRRRAIQSLEVFCFKEAAFSQRRQRERYVDESVFPPLFSSD